jgi:hypothetical protein
MKSFRLGDIYALLSNRINTLKLIKLESFHLQNQKILILDIFQKRNHRYCYKNGGSKSIFLLLFSR